MSNRRRQLVPVASVHPSQPAESNNIQPTMVPTYPLNNGEPAATQPIQTSQEYHQQQVYVERGNYPLNPTLGSPVPSVPANMTIPPSSYVPNVFPQPSKVPAGPQIYPSQPDYSDNVQPSAPQIPSDIRGLGGFMGPMGPSSTTGASTGVATVQIEQSNIIQMTHHYFPAQSSDISSFKMPFGCVIEPMKQEDLISVDYQQELSISPPRCAACKAFMNCYTRFTGNGAQVCPLCGLESRVDAAYESEVLSFGYRGGGVLPVQLQERRPELACEGYEIIAPPAYRIRQAETFESILFVLDVSERARRSGLLQNTARLIQAALERLAAVQERHMAGIILFNTQVHLLVVRGPSRFELYTNPDPSTPFVPAPRDVIVSLKSRGAPLLEFLSKIDEVVADLDPVTGTPNSATGGPQDLALLSAIEMAHKCMLTVGGTIFFVSSGASSCGFGNIHEKFAERRRAGQQGSRLDIKQALATPFDVITDMGVKCSTNYVSVNGILATSDEFVDFAALSNLVRLSGGNLIHIPDFTPQLHWKLLSSTISAITSLDIGLESCIRVRVGHGVEVKQIYGIGHQVYGNMVHLPHSDKTQAFGVELQINDSLKAGQYTYIQLSFLFTDKENRRWVRVVTKRIPVGTPLQFVSSVQTIPILTVLAKKAATVMRRDSETSSSSTHFINLQGQTVSQCLNSSSGAENIQDGIYGQLIDAIKYCVKLSGARNMEQLPGGLKDLPYLVFCLSKCPCFRPSRAKVLIDERAAFMLQLERSCPERIVGLACPTVISLTRGRLRPAPDFITTTDVAVIQAQYYIYVFLGADVQTETLRTLLPNVTNENDLLNVLQPDLEAQGPLGDALRDAVNTIRASSGLELPVIAVSGRSQFTGPIYAQMVEGRTDGMTYQDFCSLINRNIQSAQK